MFGPCSTYSQLLPVSFICLWAVHRVWSCSVCKNHSQTERLVTFRQLALFFSTYLYHISQITWHVHYEFDLFLFRFNYFFQAALVPQTKLFLDPHEHINNTWWTFETRWPSSWPLAARGTCQPAPPQHRSLPCISPGGNRWFYPRHLHPPIWGTRTCFCTLSVTIGNRVRRMNIKLYTIFRDMKTAERSWNRINLCTSFSISN